MSVDRDTFICDDAGAFVELAKRVSTAGACQVETDTEPAVCVCS